ncbi:hypothetical protein WR25_02546 [Diploscapter pachys]|uniref:Uncharacterized protein n=1 Tax=Diploscapter pachys TaxID=2018661 RepID=A0A2A2KUA4_9BILA|nr:hypothetical protein WR25_02546 [Diploscapter pachys]
MTTEQEDPVMEDTEICNEEEEEAQQRIETVERNLAEIREKMEDLRNVLIRQERRMIALREQMKTNLRQRWRWLKSNGRTDEECIRNMIGMSTHIRKFIKAHKQKRKIIGKSWTDYHKAVNDLNKHAELFGAMLKQKEELEKARDS